ncbi:Rv3235 family protein [Nocardia sp. NPDC052566]|uniref:Rv3235 family protein n=1 Tax=Nocardia sp. NPDC052566 TaxID=3364330 RepID=UPI0037C73927
MHDHRPSLWPAPASEPPAEHCLRYDPRRGLVGTRAARPVCRPRMPMRNTPARQPESFGLERVLREGHARASAEAKEFADRALRSALEILDHRRPVGQLAKVAAPSVVSAVAAMIADGRVPSRTLGTAILVRVDVIPIDEGAAEICARYERGPRRLAIAARIDRTTEWRLTAFQVA